VVPDGSRSIPLGRPISNTQVYILDANQQPTPVGVAGEIYISGEGVARGYLNRPELTAERFLPDPFRHAPGVRIYKTGDLGRWLPDGKIEFLGRNDSQVKIRGFRVELGEIEARLSDHPEAQELDRLALPKPELISTATYRAPRSSKEEILCSLFAEVLGVEQVGIDDNFFELGGHSLMALRLINRIPAMFGVQLSMRTLFASPTVAQLSAQLQETDR
jgi:acyl-CoA synthetase (AMP-forming)/AMP-acid ligase II